MSEARQIHLIDDEESIRRSTRFMLGVSGFEVATYASGAEFLDIVDGAGPGCILLDIRMPDMDGLEVQAALNARGVTMPVIVFTGHGDVTTAVAAMQRGAIDFLEKPFDRNTLIEAIERGFAQLGAGDDRGAAQAAARELIARLSPPEQAVLRGLARGLPNGVIADELAVPIHIVELNRANAMARLGVRTLAEALRIAFAAGPDDRGEHSETL
jgi:two-component system, LuxR family, response regulator FixJ